MPRRVARRAHIAVALTFASLVLGTLVPTVAADDGLEVTTPFPSVAVAPGDDVSFDLTITSSRTAIVGLSLSGVPAGWGASLLGGGNVVEGVSVTPDVDGEVRLDVDVPADAAAGSATISVRATRRRRDRCPAHHHPGRCRRGR